MQKKVNENEPLELENNLIEHDVHLGEPLINMVLSRASVQIFILIILSVLGAELFILSLTYFRASFPLWLDDLIFNPIFLIFLLNPFTGSENELSLVIFNPTPFALLLLPFVYIFLFRPWVKRSAARKKAQDMRIKKERVEYARRVKNEFLSNVSHEQRTHLNSIMGFSDVLKQKIAGELNPKQTNYVNNIHSSANMLLAIINDIIDLNKIESGKVEIVVEKILLLETLNENLALIQEKADKKNVALKKEFDPVLEYMEMDKHKFKQIMSNLLDNAVKFSKEGGGIVTVTTKKENDMAKISVHDTGVGIRENDMDKLFTEFPHIESGLEKKPDGTGLGLAISKKLVEMCGGKIWAESEFGVGSTFSFLMPLTFEKKA
jgi:signal transduction histidine kinase